MFELAELSNFAFIEGHEIDGSQYFEERRQRPASIATATFDGMFFAFIFFAFNFTIKKIKGEK